MQGGYSEYFHFTVRFALCRTTSFGLANVFAWVFHDITVIRDETQKKSCTSMQSALQEYVNARSSTYVVGIMRLRIVPIT